MGDRRRNDFRHFNPLHREGGDCIPLSLLHQIDDFNPLHREGGDFIRTVPNLVYDISIHSTARVETGTFRKRAGEPRDFNPLHREGGDLQQPTAYIRASMISIHSTARVETTFLHPRNNRIPQFQSTPPRGWRLIISLRHISSNTAFQSTPPRGWRPVPGFYTSLPQYFNPLHREGGDDFSPGLPCRDGRFQSTPPRGWRPMSVGVVLMFVPISIHSTARVETMEGLILR